MADEARKETEENGQPIPTIPELFKGKCVLVTGATGFVGKVLVEKLLRSCPGIRELCILLRSSKDDIPDRLREYMENPIFERLRKEQPDAINKIRALMGDVKLEKLGLSGWHLRKVVEEVSFVFHCAANVRFDDEAKSTITVNLVGVDNVLKLCNSCKKLQAFVHVSTAYSFCNHSVICEKVYPELVKPEHVIEASGWMTEDQLKILCTHYVQGRPSLYHFSKALAETLIVESQLNFPAIIVRPSIVTAALAEPFPGWIDNHNGPTGFILVGGKAIVKTLLVDPKVNADWVPVDVVANTLIVAAHYISVKSSRSSTKKLSAEGKIPIVNCTCPESNMTTWKKVTEMCIPLLRKYPTMDVYGRPGGTITSSTVIFNLRLLFSHYLPAALIDGLSCLTFRKPRLIRLYNRIHRVLSHLLYYSNHSFTFRSSNMQALVDHMEPEDKDLFPIDQSIVDWSRYCENYVLGVRRYFKRESDDTLTDARSRMMRIHYTWLLLKMSSWFGIYYVMMKCLQKRGFLENSLLLAPLLPLKSKMASFTA